MVIDFRKMTFNEMIGYWRECLNDLGNGSDVEIASRMVAVGASDYFDESQVEANGVTQSDFSKLFELVVDLEDDIRPDDPYRPQAWAEVRRLLEALENAQPR
jgi:hypothetical protein